MRDGLPTYTLAEARAAGLHRYWPTHPCRRGHEAMRFASTGACSACLGLYRKNRVARLAKATADGKAILSLKVHADDRATILAYAEALAMARKISY